MQEPFVKISVVVPVRNEEENIPLLAREIGAALTPLGHPWECLWVNDASTDGSLFAIQSLCRDSPSHRLVDLDGPQGQSAALAAGFAAARGALLCTLDGDGQNDPADLPALIGVLDRGEADIAVGIRAYRRDNLIRKFSSRIGNGFRNRLTGVRVHDSGCSLRAFRPMCMRGIPVFKGMHRFIPTLIAMQGYRLAEQPVSHRPRTRGITKYGVWNRLWVGIGDTLAVCWMQRRLVWPKVKPARPHA